MNNRTITNPDETRRIIMEAGMLGRIKPMQPGRPGCVAMFPHRDTDITSAGVLGTYYIADRIGDDYTLVALEQHTLEQAYAAYMAYANKHVTRIKDPRLHILPQEQPVNN